MKDLMDLFQRMRRISFKSFLSWVEFNSLYYVISDCNIANLNKNCHFNNKYRGDLKQSFRSSWEANYARILKYKNLKYEYEPKAFNLKEKGYYIPDFKVGKKWVEIKGRFTEEDLRKIYNFKVKYKNESLEVIGPIKYNKMFNKYKKKIKLEENNSKPYIVTKLAGITFNNRVEKIKKLSTESYIEIKRDINNKYDRNAIKVINKDKEIIGYIPKELAIIIAPRIDKGEKYYCKIHDLITQKDKFSVKIKVFNNKTKLYDY